MASLTRVEAEARSALIDVTAYDVSLNLDAGERTFGSTSTVRFTSREPGASTFLDVKAVEVHSITLNGKEVDPSAVRGQRVVLEDLQAENEVTVVATMAYSKDGQGLHRAVDSADGRHYVYGHLFLDAAPRVFACFDQPDLKAPYDVRVQAPSDWLVVGNGAATQTSEGQWTLATTPPLATYFVTVCAGPYVSVKAEHDGIPLGIHARASLREALERDAEQMMTVTKQSLDYYHSLFGIRYPFGEYHQVFVPEFNAGAMENPGCVTLRDPYLFRDGATHEEVLTRTNTIAHECAHMWFGDLVTMKWWDDLWLNESFAEYMAHRTTFEGCGFDDAWIDSSVARKAWGYAAERMPSTHPVAGSPAPDGDTALQNFDGISYAKGAATLRQLIAYIGDEAFLAGVRDHLTTHSFGNADLADFLGAMERASGKDLDAWADAWLRTAQLDTIELDLETGDGVIAGASLRRTRPKDYPADRPHSLDVAGWSGGEEVFRVETVLDRDDMTLPDLVGAPAARVVVPNAADLTWATVTLDPATVEALPTELAQIPDGQARAVVWTALVDGVCLGTVDPRQMLRVFEGAWALETHESILSRMAIQMVGRIIPQFLPAAEQEAATQVVARAAATLLERAEPGSTTALLAARYLARTSDDVELLRRWAAGEGVPEGLAGDNDLRWLVLRNLAGRGAVGEAEIDAALERDNTMQGGLQALYAKAARPTAEAKAWAWEQITGDHDRSNYEMVWLAQGFWQAGQLDLVRPYAERYFTDVPAMAGRVGEDALNNVAKPAFPSVVVEPATLELLEQALAGGTLTPAVHRAMVDTGSQLREAVTSRATWGA
ncbi:aminopeptidase N [Oryzihumus leptocrescens]|uniref:Aminopeptidase N n=1 Tax=Oryzihumus leptocrescens TaxID=297536 RepID=A0A542ZMQ2_9MICO|nr:aminopeptidase N [Oryzihumus leptocrescens]TQL61674.1 aminopeptidase N [Oryzihumus leptocrescens]